MIVEPNEGYTVRAMAREGREGVSSQGVTCITVKVESFTHRAMRKHISGFQAGRKQGLAPNFSMMPLSLTCLLHQELRKFSKTMTMSMPRK